MIPLTGLTLQPIFYSGKLKIDPEELITQTTAARMRGVSVQAILRLIQRGKLKTVVIDGHTFLLRAEVEKFKPGVGGRPRVKTGKPR
ncbi:MAG: hypothetical protein ACREDR_17140 [Blastocatellia bacterium]